MPDQKNWPEYSGGRAWRSIGWFLGVEFACEVGGGDDFSGGWVVGLFDFDAEDVAGAEHVAGEEDEGLVGREADVGLLAIVVVGHVDETLGLEDAGLPEAGFVEGAVAGGEHVRVEELDPFAVGGFGDLAGIAAVAGEEIEIFGEIEMNRPLVALHVEGGTLAGLQVVAGEEEVFAFGVLPVVPDGFAIEPPELVARDLHGHGAFVDEGVVGAVSVDHPDTIDLLPGAFVAVHEELWIGWREEEMVNPVSGVKKG